MLLFAVAMAHAEAAALQNLEAARRIALKDHTLYPQVVPGVITAIAPTASLELRRWGAEFLAETFASQVVTTDEKQQLSLIVLDTLKGYLSRKEMTGEDEDTSVVKSAVQCAASIYPQVFRHTVGNSSDNETWPKIAAIKSSILRRMDTALPGVRICCIKFVAAVVQTQTPGLIADPRRPENNEISLALVPRDHPIIPPANLEAEASGLLDRLLGVLQDNSNDPLIVTATLNALSTLVHRRASISAKILTAVLSFNPLKLVDAGMSGKDKISTRSMTRTTMSFLLNFLKRNPNGAFAIRIQQHIERLKHNLNSAFSDTSNLKRPAPDEPIDGLNDLKRQRVNADITNGTSLLQQQPSGHQPLPAGPVSLAQLWTLTNNQAATAFHVERLPPASVAQLVRALMPAISDQKLTAAINVVRSRWLSLDQHKPDSTLPDSMASTKDVDDDGYDPAAGYSDQVEQSPISIDHGPPNELESDVAMGLFKLPPSLPLSAQERAEYAAATVARVFTILRDLDTEVKAKGKPMQTQHGFNRLATATAIGHDRDGWIILATRLATRTNFDLGGSENKLESPNGDRSMAKKVPTSTLDNALREALLGYVMESFRARIDVAINWLNEEWYSERLLQRRRQEDGEDVEEDDLPTYWRWTLRLLDNMMPLFDVKDGRIIIRLLSEVPAVNRAIFDRVKKIAEDPERIQISTNTLLYLIMFRPPVRQMAIDCAEEMYKENSGARSSVKKVLARWRPGAVEQDAVPTGSG